MSMLNRLFLIVFFAVIPIMSGCASSKPLSAVEQVVASSGELRDVLVAAVTDSGRLQQMLAITEKASSELQADIVATEKLRQEQSRINMDYNASRDDFRQVNNRLMILRQEARTKVLNTRQALAQLATDAEWKKISSRDLAILSL